MPVPAEYERASSHFYAFLLDAREEASLWSTHVTYTMTQSVFQVFRRRLSLEHAILFANALPICLRALFVTDWNIHEDIKPFGTIEELNKEVKTLRPDHNFSPEDAIKCVSKALWRHVDVEIFQKTLNMLPEEGREFWRQ